uniref:Ribosomal protein S4 n=1 Tax=Chloropicon laureae TaxID=464258 RepID=A0A4D6C4L3_9CHLO|nr:ribosomal protein S4 [Chloropicon laureae]QBX98580.1 ribosomal protein S4 [Chloropicon laureae]
MRRKNLFKLFTDAGCVFVADKKSQRGMLRAQMRHRNLPGYPWKETEGFKLFLLNMRIFRALYGFMKKKTLRRIAGKSKRITFLRHLESRVDVVLSRSGVVPNIWKARQLIRHGHVELNKSKVSDSGLLVGPGDIIQISRSYITGHEYPLTSKIFSKKPEHLEIDYASYRIVYLFYPEKLWYPARFDFDYVWKGLIV